MERQPSVMLTTTSPSSAEVPKLYQTVAHLVMQLSVPTLLCSQCWTFMQLTMHIYLEFSKKVLLYQAFCTVQCEM